MTAENNAGLDQALLTEAIAHDLNNLLTAVLGCSDELRTVIPRKDPAQEDVREIRSAAQDASLLVKLLSPRNIQSSVTLETLDLEVLLRIAVRLARKLLPRAVDVRLDHGTAGLTATGDAIRVIRILLGLSTSIGHRVGEDGVVLISASSRNSETTLRVVGAPACIDEDGDMPEDLVDFAHSMRGTLRGLRCRWELILPDDSSQNENEDKNRVGLDRVLVAEPEDLLRSFLVSTLGAENPSVATDAASLFRSLELAETEFDLALIAIELVGLDPLEDYLKIREANPQLVLAFIGGNGSTAKQLNALLREDPKAHMLFKPFGVSQLMTAITDMMGKP